MSVDRALVRRLAVEVAGRLDGLGFDGQVDDIGRQALAAKLLDEQLHRYTKERVTAGEPTLTASDEADLKLRVLDELFDAGELARLTRVPGVTNIWRNPDGAVWVRFGDGRTERAGPIADSESELNEMVSRLARRSGTSEKRWDAGKPSVSVALPDGSRLHALRGVVSATALSVRVHGHLEVDLADLRALDTLSPALEATLRAAVRGGLNIVVSGGTDAGKTTLLRALVNEVDPGERIVTVEDTFELHLSTARHPNLVATEVREANVEREGDYGLRALVMDARRMAPDRLIVGETRGEEILDMFDAMRQEQDGSMSTIHANDSANALVQMMANALKAPEHLTPEAAALVIASAVNLVVHIGAPSRGRVRGAGRRVVSEVREVVGWDGPTVTSNLVCGPDGQGRAVPTGARFRENTLALLTAAGWDPAVMEAGHGGWSP